MRSITRGTSRLIHAALFASCAAACGEGGADADADPLRYRLDPTVEGEDQ